MTLKEAMKQPEALGDEGMRAYTESGGAGDNQLASNLGTFTPKGTCAVEPDLQEEG